MDRRCVGVQRLRVPVVSAPDVDPLVSASFPAEEALPFNHDEPVVYLWVAQELRDKAVAVERANYEGAMADLAALVEVARQVADGDPDLYTTLARLEAHLDANYPKEPTMADPLTEAEILARWWYAVPDDMVGGWAIATLDKPTSQIEKFDGESVPVDLVLTEGIARHIAGLHNAFLEQKADRG